jgi:hypothetical protein
LKARQRRRTVGIWTGSSAETDAAQAGVEDVAVEMQHLRVVCGPGRVMEQRQVYPSEFEAIRTVAGRWG